MTTIDPEQERQRLAQSYAEQSDGELENLARQAHELTEVAREALRSELARRGLYIGQLEESVAAPAEDGAEFRDLVTIRSFWYLAEAELAKGLLDAAGFESFLFDENIVGLGWYANAVNGVKLRVDARNAEAANQILKDQLTAGAASLENLDNNDPDNDGPGNIEPGSTS